MITSMLLCSLLKQFFNRISLKDLEALPLIKLMKHINKELANLRPHCQLPIFLNGVNLLQLLNAISLLDRFRPFLKRLRRKTITLSAKAIMPNITKLILSHHLATRPSSSILASHLKTLRITSEEERFGIMNPKLTLRTNSLIITKYSSQEADQKVITCQP